MLGLRLEDLRLGEWRVFIADGKGGHQRLVPISQTFFATVADYLNEERPADAVTDRVFVVLKGARRGQPLSADGLDQILTAARERAGLAGGTCHELRHTCFTRLRQAGMPIEAIQAQAGHRSIASTRVYLHLGDDWLAGEYRRAAEAIEAQAMIGAADERPARAAGAVAGIGRTAVATQGARDHLGRDRRQGAADGAHDGPVLGPARGVGTADARLTPTR